VVSRRSRGLRELRGKGSQRHRYEWHALNKACGYRHIQSRSFENVLGFGSAYGEELLPIVDAIRAVTIVDSSSAFVIDKIGDLPVAYVSATESGALPFEDGTFDLITSFGVLHHIPNVTYVIHELSRCLQSGGIMLVREPIVSMGDWRQPRTGLTKRERGIPHVLAEEAFEKAGLRILHAKFCVCPPVYRLCRRLGVDPYNSPAATRLDLWLAAALKWNVVYHRNSAFRKIAPSCGYWVLTKGRQVPR